ncbi:hypothetical protein Q7P37_004765 [Cladosporium fusiforme]
MQSIKQGHLLKQSTRNLFRPSAPIRAFQYTPKLPIDYVVMSRRDFSTQQDKLPERIHGPTPCGQRPTRRDEALPKQSPDTENLTTQTSDRFDLTNGVYIVTGGARGIGLAMAESLAEAGGTVFCFDRNESPDDEFAKANEQLQRESKGGSLHYRRVDVTNRDEVNATVETIADANQRLDGLIAAAGVNQVTPAMDYAIEDARKMLETNFLGVFTTATACAGQMLRYRSRGSICMVASMSGMIANKGMLSPVYNASKAAVIQLAKNLAMEWSKVHADGQGGIRVNALSPGHVTTPMVRQVFQKTPGVKDVWEAENMMGRLADPSEFKGAALFLLSNASSFMTGNNLVIDGGHTAW